MISPEKTLHQNVCQYLRLRYQDVLFRSDFGAGAKLTMVQSIQQKKLQKCRAWPDLMICETRGEYSGLFLELKSSMSTEVLRNGTVGNGAHVKEQREVLEMLKSRGYFAEFAVGFDQAKEKIDQYLANEPR